MRKKVVQDLIETSREIIRAFWHKDVNLLSHYLDNDVFYCGADPSQYYSSKNELMNYLYSVMNDSLKSELTPIDFQCVFNQQNTCIIVGRFFLMTDMNSLEMIHEQQRCTLVWSIEKEKEGRIVYLNTPDRLGQLEDGELFPHKMGSSTYHYYKDMVKKLMEPDKTILVNDNNKHTCLIPLKDIYYVMAFQHNTVLYTNKGEITSTVSFNKMEELLGTQFFKIHRSYTINRDYIRLFGPDYVELTNGDKVPMTKRNRTQLINSLMQCTNVQSGIDEDEKGAVTGK